MSRTDLEGKLSFAIKRTDGGTPDYDQSFVLGSGDFTWDGSKYPPPLLSKLRHWFVPEMKLRLAF